MKVALLALVLTLLTVSGTHAQTVTLTFDNLPDGWKTYNEYYAATYGVRMDFELSTVNHSGSSWGLPHSGSNVLMLSPVGYDVPYFELLSLHDLNTGLAVIATSVSGYFSTQPGTILQLLGFSPLGGPPVSAYVGGTGESWNNTYVELDSSRGINEIMLTSVTTDSLHQFCVDDITINFIPEPSSLLALLCGLAGLGAVVRRRRR